MLGAKPYLEWLEHNKARALGYDNVADRGSMESNPSAASPNGHVEMDHEEVLGWWVDVCILTESD